MELLKSWNRKGNVTGSLSVPKSKLLTPYAQSLQHPCGACSFPVTGKNCAASGPPAGLVRVVVLSPELPLKMPLNDTRDKGGEKWVTSHLRSNAD